MWDSFTSSFQGKCWLRKIHLEICGFTWFCCFLQSFREDFSLLPPFAETMNQTCSEWSLMKRSCAITKEISLFVISFQISWLNCNVSVSVCAGFCYLLRTNSSINPSGDQQPLIIILFLGWCYESKECYIKVILHFRRIRSHLGSTTTTRRSQSPQPPR